MYNDSYGIAAIIILIGSLIILLTVKKRDGKDWVSAVLFTIILFIGTALYYFAIDFRKDERFAFSIFFIIISSLGSAIQSFVGNFNIQSHLSALAKESQIFSIAVVIHFITAVFLTSFTVIRLFGKKLINEIRVRLISLKKKYVVIGSGEKAIIFLKHLSYDKKKNTIVILENSQAEKTIELINNGFAVVSVNEDKKNAIKTKDEYDKLRRMAFYDALKKAGAMKCIYKTNVISISEYDEINLLTARILTMYINNELGTVEKNDNKIKLTKQQEKILNKIKLDIRIMYSFLERTEHFTYIDNSYGKLTFFNYYKLNAQKFCMENPITRLIPNDWIDVKKAKLNDKYKIGTIFVGFGSVNKAMLKTSIINNQLLDIDYNALIVCKNAEIHQKIFENSAIGLFDITDNENNIIKRGAEIKPNPDGSVYLVNPNERNNIRFKEADAMTVNLYDIIINEIEGKLYKNTETSIKPYDYSTIIISLGDDRLNIETALELRQKLYEADLLTARKGNTKYQRVRIFVKIKQDSVYTDKNLINNDIEKIECEIITYGADEEIITEDYIINEKLDVLAKNIANRYDGNKEKETILKEWNTSSQLKRESNRYAAMAIRVKLNLLGFDLIKGMETDLNNLKLYQERYETDKAIDLKAKRIKLENELNNQTINEDLLKFKIDNEIINLAEYDNGDFADTARNNLAKLEHMRWNVFHLANDWTKLPKKEIGVGRKGRQDEIAKQHACITTFHGLNDLMLLQKEAEKKESEEKKCPFIEALSLLRADTIRHDFSTMDFLLELSNENQKKLKEAENDQNKEFSGILTGSGYFIEEL